MNRAGILVNRKSKIPLHRQLESALRDAILFGDLAPGERVLSSRELQTHLGLSRNSVLDALGQLYAEGLLVTKQGVGTFVAPQTHLITRVNSKRTSAPTAPATPTVPSKNAEYCLSVSAMAGNR